MHDKVNANKCSFTLDAIEDAKESCKNIPILAYIKTKEDDTLDFDEHNIITRVVSTPNGLKLSEYYLEKPIGLIPESNNFTIEKIDDLNWVTVEGYIWKGYCNEALEIIENSSSKGVSMEIKVLEGHKEGDIYNITKFIFRGCTVLGDDVAPAMGELARLEKFNTVDYSKDIERFSELLSKNLGKEEEALSIDEKKIEEVVEETTIEVEETITEPVEEAVVEDTTVEVEEAVVEDTTTDVEEDTTVEDTTVEGTITEPVEEVEVAFLLLPDSFTWSPSKSSASSRTNSGSFACPSAAVVLAVSGLTPVTALATFVIIFLMKLSSPGIGAPF
jgi:hypothetical protein